MLPSSHLEKNKFSLLRQRLFLRRAFFVKSTSILIGGGIKSFPLQRVQMNKPFKYFLFQDIYHPKYC